MPRPKGSKNKKTVKRNIFLRILLGKYILSNEDQFIDDLTKGYLKWRAKGEVEFSQVYKMLLNKYTNETK
jgi:hypothetical protein